MPSFRHLSLSEKLHWIAKHSHLNQEQLSYLQSNSQNAVHVTNFSENVIGSFQLPFSVIPNVHMDNQVHQIPFAIEESSVVAALSHAAKFCHQYGKISTYAEKPSIVAQVFLPQLDNEKIQPLKSALNKIQAKLNDTVAQSMFKRGGGVTHITWVEQCPHYLMHINIDPCDAHGANIACQIAETACCILQENYHIRRAYGILSNHTDVLTHSTCVLENLDPNFVDQMLDMNAFAQCSEHRQITHNKGIMNGIDGVLMATGNDWRANSSNCIHYSAKNGPLATWEKSGKNGLMGQLSIPLQLGVVGGLTVSHPTAKLALAILQQPTRTMLSRIVAGVGLLQNFSALKAIGSRQLVKGHMSLHVNNRLMAEGKAVNAKNIKQLQNLIQTQGYYSKDDINKL